MGVSDVDQEHTDNMTGFDNGILNMHGMCPSVELMEHYQMDHEKAPTHFMRGTATEVWWNDDFEIM